MKKYSREQMISLSGDSLHHNSVHQKLINSIKKLYGSEGRPLGLEKDSSEFESLDKLGFSKFECDYAIQSTQDPEKAANLLFMEYNIRQLMQTSFHFESFFVWENAEKSSEAMNETHKPICLVASYDEFKQMSRNVKDALAKNIPIVSEYFLWDSQYLKVTVLPEDYPIKEVNYLYDTYNDRNFLYKWSLEEFMKSDSLKHLLVTYDDSLSPIQASATAATLTTSSSLSLLPSPSSAVPLPNRVPILHDTNKTETISHAAFHGNANKILQIITNKEAPQEFNKVSKLIVLFLPYLLISLAI